MTDGVHERARCRDDLPVVRAAAGVEVEYAGDRPTVVVSGQVHREKVGEVSDTVGGLVAVGVRELVVDLTASWDGAALLSVLARTRAELADHGGSLRVTGVALPEFLAALTDAPLDEVFLVYDTVRSDASRGGPRRARSVQRRTESPQQDLFFGGDHLSAATEPPPKKRSPPTTRESSADRESSIMTPGRRRPGTGRAPT